MEYETAISIQTLELKKKSPPFPCQGFAAHLETQMKLMYFE